MADPVSATLMGGSVFGAISSFQQAQAQTASLQAQQNAQNYNAQLYQQQAQDTMAQSNSQANLGIDHARQTIGAQRAAIAESGMAGSVTGNALIDQSAANAELDRQNTLYSGLINANSLNAQASQSSYAAQTAGNQIASSQASGYIGAATSLLGGYAKYGQQQNTMNQASYRGYGRNTNTGYF